MKKLGFTIIAAVVLALPLCAQLTMTTVLRAKIPFEFSVQNKTAAPGEYEVIFRDGSVVQLVGNDGHDLQLSGNQAGYGSSHEPKLVFHRYGNQYFLSEIWRGSTGRSFPMSRVERELKKTLAAKGQSQTEIVLAMR